MPDLAEALQEALARGREAWPEIELDGDEFVRYVAQRLGEATAEQVEALHAADLYLAFACARGDRRAIERFERDLLGPAVARAAGSDDADDLRQRTQVRLLVGDGETPPKIEQYGGSGPLKAWVRITVLRAIKDERRGAARARHYTDLAADLLKVAGITQDPELDEVRARLGPQFRAAFEAAVGSIPDDDRRLIRQHHLEKMTLDQLGKAYGVHRVTIARRLARARSGLLDATRDHLRQRLALPESQFDNVVDLVISRMEVSFARLLKTDSGSES